MDDAPADPATEDVPDWAPTPEERIVEVASCRHEVEAEALAAAVRAAGLPCRVVQGNLGFGTDLAFDFHNEPKLWVLGRHEAAARRVIGELRGEIEGGAGPRP